MHELWWDHARTREELGSGERNREESRYRDTLGSPAREKEGGGEVGWWWRAPAPMVDSPRSSAASAEGEIERKGRGTGDRVAVGQEWREESRERDCCTDYLFSVMGQEWRRRESPCLMARKSASVGLKAWHRFLQSVGLENASPLGLHMFLFPLKKSFCFYFLRKPTGPLKKKTQQVLS